MGLDESVLRCFVVNEWLNSDPADTVRINVIVRKSVKRMWLWSDAKECATPWAARECVRFKRTKSVDWQRSGHGGRRRFFLGSTRRGA